MEELTSITERTEYYDLAVEKRAFFDVGLWKKNPQDDRLSMSVLSGCIGYIPMDTQFFRYYNNVVNFGGAAEQKAAGKAHGNLSFT